MDFEDVPDDLKLVRIEIPESAVHVVSPSSLPPDWRAVPAPTSTRRFGDAWLEAGKNLAMRVPSVALPSSVAGEEGNVVLNPMHPAFARLPAPTAIDVALDLRSLGG